MFQISRKAMLGDICASRILFLAFYFVFIFILDFSKDKLTDDVEHKHNKTRQRLVYVNYLISWK